MLFSRKKLETDISSRLKQKANQSQSTYRVAALGFDNKGNLIGVAVNAFSNSNRVGRGSGRHAERTLMYQYRSNISFIIIARIGLSQHFLPIDPCPVCQKVADKLGIKIYSIDKLLNISRD